MLGTLTRILGAVVLVTAFMVEAAVADGVFRLGRESDAKTLDPPITIENLDIWTMNNLNAYLVRATKNADNLEPDLATHWEISPDGLTYTLPSARGQVLGWFDRHRTGCPVQHLAGARSSARNPGGALPDYRIG